MVDRDQKWKLENQEEDLFIHNCSFDIKNNSKLLKKIRKKIFEFSRQKVGNMALVSKKVKK